MTCISTASPVSLGTKSGLQPWIGWGFHDGLASCRRAVRVALLSGSAREHGRVGGLADHDLRCRPLLGEHTRNALERAAGAEAGDPVIEPLAGEVGEDLGRRGPRVHVGVGLVLELAGEEPAVRAGQLNGLVHHARALLGRRREHHLRAEETHETPALHAEGLGHRHDKGITLLRAHHREADAGVATRGLDYGLSRFERSRPFGVLDDAEGEAVLHGAERIEGLDLHMKIDAGRCEAIDLDDRRVADGAEYVCKSGHEVPPFGVAPKCRCKSASAGAHP